MAKTPLKESIRESIFNWMVAEYDSKNKDSTAKQKERAIAAANKAIRVKYPEDDMVVLRKYKLTRQDTCLKFLNNDTQQFFGVDFGRQPCTSLADLPIRAGCNSNDVFPVSPKAQTEIESYTKAKEAASAKRSEKLGAYKSFLAACRTVDEFNETVPLPESLRLRYMSGGALIAINPETIAAIKKDFK